MWSGIAGPNPSSMGSAYGNGAQVQQNQQKHDIFVGNLAFNTTEDQLHQTFSEIGRVIKVRLVTDAETGKPRGFAFVEFEDPQAALSAIRNMNEYELNGRRLRVNFSNSSHLEALAGKLGMDLSQNQNTKSNQQGRGPQSKSSNQAGTAGGGANQNQPSSVASSGNNASGGTQAVADALKAMSKGEIYDVVAKLKEIADRDPDEARRIISGHPQLPEAILFLLSKLDMVKAPIPTQNAAMMSHAAVAGATSVASSGKNTTSALIPSNTMQQRAMDPRSRAHDPRQSAASMQKGLATGAAPSQTQQSTIVAAPPRSDPRQSARIDPRRAAATTNQSPRMQQPLASAQPPPPPQQQLAPPPPPQQYGMPGMPPSQMQSQQPPPPPPQQHQGGVIANLDPSLVQQVMSLTPQQIAQLPPDKQQSILALRQQITGAGI